MEFLSGLGNPPAFEQVNEQVTEFSLFGLTSQRVYLGDIISFDESTTTSVNTFEVTPTTLAQYIQFDFEESSLYIDYETLNQLDGDAARKVSIRLVI